MTRDPLISLEELMNLLPEHVYWLDKDGVYRGCNDSQARMMGYLKNHEVIGKRNKDLICFHDHPELADIIDKNNSIIMQSAEPRCFEELAHDYRGILSTYRSHKIPLKDSDNNVIGLLGSSHKIDDIKLREDRLMAEKESTDLTLKNIIAHLPGHIYWKNSEGIVLGSNDTNARNAGLSCGADMVGKSDYDLFSKDEADMLRAVDTKIMETNLAMIAEEPRTQAHGEVKIYLSHKVPLKNNKDNNIGILGISMDITELKIAQEQAAIAKAKIQAQEEIQKAVLTFTGAMSHDLRTPLSTIKLVMTLVDRMMPTLLQIYKESIKTGNDPLALNAQQLQSLENSCKNIMRTTRQADSYIDATLKIIRGAAAGSELLKTEDLVPCPIEDIIRRVVRAFPYCEEDSVKIHYDSTNLFSFMGNSIFMSRILENLIKNSFEQINLRGKGEVYIWCENTTHFNYLQIKDTAGGADTEVLKDIFNGFSSTKRGGTGLGLSCAKQIMQAFGGDISCDIVEEDCIQFTLSFPVISTP